MSKYSDGKDYKVIALCTAKFYGSEEIDFLRTFAAGCKERKCKIVIFSTYSDFYHEDVTDASEKNIFSLMDVSRFDAVVIASETLKSAGLAEEIAEKAIRAGVPVFSLIRKIPGCPSISFGYGTAFEQIIRHLVEFHKLTRFVFIAGMKGNPFSEARIECFKKVLAENNVSFDDADLYYGDFWEVPTAKVMDEFLAAGKPLPEVFVCANDFMAMEVCRKLNASGYSVPDDVRVTGFDGTYLERFNYPRLTTAEQNLDGLVEVLFEAIDKSISNIPIKDEYIVDFKFRKSQSCGCVKSRASAEEIKKMGIAYSNTNKYLREFVSVFETLFESEAKYANQEELIRCFEGIKRHFYDVKVSNFFLMLNSDFVTDTLEVLPSVNVTLQGNEWQHYTSDMVVAMDYFKGELINNPRKIHLFDLAPHLDELLETETCLLFAPLHVMNNSIGYAANTLDVDNFEFAIYYAFLMSFRQIIETHKVRKDLENLYSLDQLTHLYNRKGFYKHVSYVFEEAKSQGKPFAFISLDMNWLKLTNDTYGHAEGDYALYSVATAMKKATNENEICSRFGGDEFVIAFSDDNAAKRAEEIVKNIKNELETQGSSHGKKYRLSVSAGYYASVPKEDTDLDSFIKKADSKMYADKKKIKESQTWQ